MVTEKLKANPQTIEDVVELEELIKEVPKLTGDIQGELDEMLATFGTQFTCFTGIKVQILTQKRAKHQLGVSWVLRVGERLMTGLIVCSLFKNLCNSGSRTLRKQRFEAEPGTVWSCGTSEGTPKLLVLLPPHQRVCVVGHLLHSHVGIQFGLPADRGLDLSSSKSCQLLISITEVSHQ